MCKVEMVTCGDNQTEIYHLILHFPFSVFKRILDLLPVSLSQLSSP